MKKTALYDLHVKQGAAMVDFGGWNMPVRYTGDIAEHEAVRTQAGIFDVSHMGEIRVEGPDAEAFLDYAVTARVRRISDGQCLYSPICYENGGIVDDVLIYRFSSHDYLVVVNASNTDKDFEWLSSLASSYASSLRVRNVSNEWSQIAIQGPRSKDILQSICSESLDTMAYYRFATCSVAGVDCIVSRTGYTGEAGFEVYCPWGAAPLIWERLSEAGRPHDLRPCGLGARDSLRFEACLPLYGHEIGPDTSPFEAGLARWVKASEDEGNFVGKRALLEQRAKGVPYSLKGIELLEPGIARQGYEVLDTEGNAIGTVTSGTFSPTLKKALAMVRVHSHAFKPGKNVYVVVRGKKIAARFADMPFYPSRARD